MEAKKGKFWIPEVQLWLLGDRTWLAWVIVDGPPSLEVFQARLDGAWSDMV